MKTQNNKCANCKHFDNSGYRDHEQTKHVGFCNRWIEVTPINETCTTFIISDQKEQYYRNLAKAEKLKIDLKSQLELFT